MSRLGGHESKKYKNNNNCNNNSNHNNNNSNNHSNNNNNKADFLLPPARLGRIYDAGSETRPRIDMYAPSTGFRSRSQGFGNELQLASLKQTLLQ